MPKEIEKRSPKLTLLKEVEKEIAVKKTEVARLVTFVRKAREHRFYITALKRKIYDKIALSVEREKALDRSLASVKKELAIVRVGN